MHCPTRGHLLRTVRSVLCGKSRIAYERDDYPFRLAVYADPITPELLHTKAIVDSSESRHARICTLI